MENYKLVQSNSYF